MNYNNTPNTKSYAVLFCNDSFCIVTNSFLKDTLSTSKATDSIVRPTDSTLESTNEYFVLGIDLKKDTV